MRDLLEQIPLLQCLVTSRQILELTPEREIVVGPLPVPSCSGGVQSVQSARAKAGSNDLNALLANESVALFVDRAQRAMPDFQLTRRERGGGGGVVPAAGGHSAGDRAGGGPGQAACPGADAGATGAAV